MAKKLTSRDWVNETHRILALVAPQLPDVTRLDDPAVQLVNHLSCLLDHLRDQEKKQTQMRRILQYVAAGGHYFDGANAYCAYTDLIITPSAKQGGKPYYLHNHKCPVSAARMLLGMRNGETTE